MQKGQARLTSAKLQLQAAQGYPLLHKSLKHDAEEP